MEADVHARRMHGGLEVAGLVAGVRLEVAGGGR
jgi:hypothetical protein